MQENQVDFSRNKPAKSLTLDSSNFNGMFEASSNHQFSNNFISMANTNSNDPNNGQVASHQTIYNQNPDYQPNLMTMQSFNFHNNNQGVTGANHLNNLNFPRTPGFLGHQDFGMMLDPGTVHFNTPQWGGMQPNIDMMGNDNQMMLGFDNTPMMMSQTHSASINDPFSSQFLPFNPHSLTNQAQGHSFNNSIDYMTPQFMPNIQMTFSPSLQAFNNRFWSLPNSGNLNLINPGNLEQVDFAQLNAKPLDDERTTENVTQQRFEELTNNVHLENSSRQLPVRAYSHGNTPGEGGTNLASEKNTKPIRSRRRRASKYQNSALSNLVFNRDAVENNISGNPSLTSEPLNFNSNEGIGARKNSIVELVAAKLHTTPSTIFNDFSKLAAPESVLATVKTVQSVSVALPNKSDGELVLPEFFFKKPTVASTTLGVLRTSKPVAPEDPIKEMDFTATDKLTKIDVNPVPLPPLLETVTSKPPARVVHTKGNPKDVPETPKKSGNRIISPAIFPKQVNDDATAFQLTSKSNYQLIMEGGNAAVGLNYNPDFEQLVKRKRLHHQASEQKRRAILALKFKDLAKVLPPSNPAKEKVQSERGSKELSEHESKEEEEEKGCHLSQSKILAGALDLFEHQAQILQLQGRLLQLFQTKFPLSTSTPLPSLEEVLEEEGLDSNHDNFSEKELVPNHSN